jgi:pimeloyl-ACP methyl ester carboxylesterase
VSGTSQNVELPGGFSPNPVIGEGEGEPVVFLHGPFGQEWPQFLSDLAKHRHVFAPSNPGGEEPEDLKLLDNLWDLVLYYDELFEALGLDGQVDLVGHSFGGMVAAEIAATFPKRVRKLVLIDAMGLWIDDDPMNDHVLQPPERQRRLLYHDQSNPEVAARLEVSDDLALAQAQSIRQFSSIAASSHFSWPIPERGLSKRLHRIRADTLIIWGADDALIPPSYGEKFRDSIPNARLELIQDAGHYPYLEQREQVVAATEQHLDG